ncbi:MAG: calcium/sodium antiporter [Leptospiraceae bacterium]|nr:calcium/sodium antiporter [Leptospiraceae bacterium]
MNIALWCLVFVVSLFTLIKASDCFIESSEKVGIRLGLSPFLVGVLIIGFGTSLPELVSSIVGVVTGAPEIVAGNVLGSNITNIFLIVGIAAVYSKSFEIQYDLLKTEIPFLLTITFLVTFMIYDGNFSFGEGIFCIGMMGIYILKLIRENSDSETEKDKEGFEKKYFFMIVLSPIFIFIGAKYTVDSVVEISNILNIGKEIIALSAVAFGTSLPEVLVTIAASKKGQPDIAIGNVIGSNIFNMVAVFGIPRMIGKIPISETIVSSTMLIHLAATFLFIIIVVDKKVNRYEGFLLLSFYLFFLFQTFGFLS